MRLGKKVAVLDENRRHTYKQPHPSKSWHEPSVLATLDGEKKQLVPVSISGSCCVDLILFRLYDVWFLLERLESAQGTRFGKQYRVSLFFFF